MGMRWRCIGGHGFKPHSNAYRGLVRSRPYAGTQRGTTGVDNGIIDKRTARIGFRQAFGRGGRLAGIFISYRREDASGWAGRLTADLRREFPQSDVFQDIASIEITDKRWDHDLSPLVAARPATIHDTIVT